MKISERTLRISAASFLAVLMVGTSYVISGPTFFNSRSVNAASTDKLLKAYAAKDTDGDGLPDWQEALYGTDPNKAISNPFGIPDGQAAQEGKLTPNSLASKLPADTTNETLTSADLPGVDPAPGSITEQFSQEFMQEFLSASGGKAMSETDKQALLEKLLANYSAKAAKSLKSSYTAVSIHTSVNVTKATYAGMVENIMRVNDVPVQDSNPLNLMEALIQNNDSSARSKLVRVSKSYRAMANALLEISVPISMSSQHLALIQSLDSLSKSTELISQYEKDPLGTLGSLSGFTESSTQLSSSITQIATSLLQDGEPAQGEPGSLLISIARISTP